MECEPIKLSVDPTQPEPGIIARAVEVLVRGGLVVFPTETVYGVAADARNNTACQRIYDAKGRADSKPLALFAPDLDSFERHGIVLPAPAKRLGSIYWPGPLTLVVPGKDGSVGLRIPDHAVPLTLLRAFDGLLAVTSANRSGAPETLTADDAEKELGKDTDLILDGGPAPGGVPSSVIRVEQDGTYSILRAGPITETEVERQLSDGRL